MHKPVSTVIPQIFDHKKFKHGYDLLNIRQRTRNAAVFYRDIIGDSSETNTVEDADTNACIMEFFSALTLSNSFDVILAISIL